MTDTYSAIQATMLNDVNRLNVISQNLANATTAGYKKQVAVTRSFSDYMAYYDVEQPNQAHLTQLGTPYIDTVSDPSMGPVKYTGNALDLVANGNTYFTVLTPDGVAYTKQGSFHKNASGVIVNPQGYPLLSESGEITVNEAEPIIDDAGNVFLDGNQIAKLKTATFKPGDALTGVGFGLYNNAGEAEELTQADIKIKQGYQEMSNVVVMEEMVKLIETMRHLKRHKNL